MKNLIWRSKRIPVVDEAAFYRKIVKPVMVQNTRSDKSTPWLMEPGGLMLHSQGLSKLNRINSIPRIDTYLFKVHSMTVLPSTPRHS